MVQLLTGLYCVLMVSRLWVSVFDCCLSLLGHRRSLARARERGADYRRYGSKGAFLRWAAPQPLVAIASWVVFLGRCVVACARGYWGYWGGATGARSDQTLMAARIITCTHGYG